LDIDIGDYKDYSPIEIELIPHKGIYGNFINILDNEDAKYYHIYFNEDSEIKNKFFISEDDNNITKIKIIIDKEIKSFYKLFDGVQCIKSIKFNQLYRRTITNMSYMFNDCTLLEEINLNNFNTQNVSDMSYMFNNCNKLKKLNLDKFNTQNVTDMNHMFSGCNSLSGSTIIIILL
jgi:surface protein